MRTNPTRLCAAADLRIGDRFRRHDTDDDPVTVTRVYTARGERVVEVAGRQADEPVRFIALPGTAVELISRREP